MTFSILTWNCLAQKFLNGKINTEFKHSQGYIYSTRKYRINKIYEILYEYDYDIVCLQEVELNNHKNKDGGYPLFKEDFKKLLDYNSYNFIEQKFKKKNNGVGNVILYKKDLFEIVYVESKSCSIICVIKDKITNRHICITNLHLRAGYANEDERINQITSIIKSVMKISSTVDVYKSVDIIICGDFNTIAKYKLEIPSGRDSVINIITNPNNKTLQHSINLKEIPISSNHTYFSPIDSSHERYDHIFYSDLLEQVGSLFLDKSIVNIKNPLPNLQWPSDHAIIGGIFKFKDN